MSLRLRTLLATLCLALPLLANAAAAQAAELEIPFERYTLPNGLEVILHRDTSAPLVDVDLWYHVGSGDETPGKSGFAHLFEHMMFQGTKNTGEDRHFAAMQEAGASDVNGSTNSHRTNYYETLPSNQLETALWLESERMAHLLPAITEKSLANQRDVVRNERRQNYDNVPYGKDRFAVAAALYPEGHPFRHLTIGLHEDLERASIEDVRNFFRTWYVPANATLVIGGDFETARAKQLVEKWFGSFPKSVKPEHRDRPAPEIPSVRRVEVHDSFAKLRRVHYAWVTPKLFTPEDAALDLLASVLAQEGTGRLYRRLVLDQPLAQRVAVYQASLRPTSEFHVVVDVRPDADLAAVEKIVGDELAAVRTRAVETRELERAVIGYETRFVFGLESLDARVEQLQAYNHILGDPGRVAWDLERYRKSTAGDVLSAAQKFLDPARAVVVVTLPVAAPQEDPAIASAAPLPAEKPVAAPQQLAFPDEPFRAQQPAAGAEPGVKTPAVERFTLANGLEVVLLARHVPPVVTLDLEIPNGQATDPAGREGLAALCMDVLDDGTQKLDKVAFEGALADLGASVGAGAGIDRDTVQARTLRRNLEPTLDLWSALLLEPGLRQADFDRDRGMRLAALRQERGSAAPVARRLAGPIYYGAAHPVGRMPTDASVGAVTLEDCRTVATSWLKPKGARLYVTGDIDRATLATMLTQRLAGWTGEPAVRSTLPPAKPLAARLVFSDVPGAAQSVIYAGEPGPARKAADFPATQLAFDVLGGDFSSRLNMNLREAKGYAYGAGAFVRYFPGELSVVRAAASVRTDATADAVREMVKELRHLAAGGITVDELRRNVNGEALALPARFATGGEAMQAIQYLIDYDLPANYWESYAATLRAVTREQADAAAAAHVHPETMTFLVVGDRAKVLDGLRGLMKTGDLPPGDVVELDADGKPVASAN